MNRGEVSLAILCLAALTGGALMLGMAPFPVSVMEDLGIGALQYGLLSGSFFLGAAIVGLLLLFKVEKFLSANLRKTVAALSCLLCASAFLTALAPEYWAVLILRLLAGAASISLTLCTAGIALNWFLDKLLLSSALGMFFLTYGTLVAAILSPPLSYWAKSLFGVGEAWRAIHLLYGLMGLSASALWLAFGKGAPTSADGGEPAPQRGVVRRVLGNLHVWTSSGILYTALSFAGAFTFIFLIFQGPDLAPSAEHIVFPLPIYLGLLLNTALFAGVLLATVKLLGTTALRRPFLLAPGLLLPALGLVVFSQPFSGVWTGILIELLLVAVAMVTMILPTWIAVAQELPGIEFDVVFNGIGGSIFLAGTAAFFVTALAGAALDAGMHAFRWALYLLSLTWLACAVGGLAIPKREEVG